MVCYSYHFELFPLTEFDKKIVQNKKFFQPDPKLPPEVDSTKTVRIGSVFSMREIN